MIRRRLLAVVAAAGILVTGGAAVAIADAPANACESAYTAPMNSTAKLKAYEDCRFDRLEVQQSRIERKLDALAAPSPSVTPSASPSATPSKTPTPSATPSQTPSQTPTVTPTPSQTVTQPPTGGVLNLPRVPWAGGAEYYKQFPKAVGFTDPNRYPIGIFYNNYENNAQLAWDVDHGINFHVEGVNTGTNAGDFSAGICFTQDELEGRDSDRPRVIATMKAEIKSCADQGRAPYTNYTGFVTSDYGTENNAYARELVNLGGIVSVDGYYYTDPSCDNPQRTDYQINAPDNAHCARSASYGNFIRNLRARDDAPYVPLFGFVENGAPNDRNAKYIQPAQMDGAAWSIVINGAGGITWFNNSFSGSCISGAVLRDAQNNPGGCNATRAAQMKVTNAAIQAMAPVLNTQSYAWNFQTGAPTDTMLKAKDGSAYIFAMIGVNGDPGSRTFTLPAGIAGTRVEVVGENRSLTVSGGKFTDTFAKETDHHIYRIVI